MLSYFLIGVVIGAVSGVPLGILGLALIDAAHRRGLRRAIAVGVGGGVGDLVYAALGVLVLGPWFARLPDVPMILCTISGIVLVGFGVVVLRAPRTVHAAPTPSPAGGGFFLGLGLVLVNPGSLMTWVVILGGLASSVQDAFGPRLCLVIGIGVGSTAWYILLAHGAHRGARALGDRFVWVGRIAATLIVGYGLFSLARGAHYFLR